MVSLLINQTALFKKSFIGMDARHLLHIMDYCDETNEDEILLSLDLEKPF